MQQINTLLSNVDGIMKIKIPSTNSVTMQEGLPASSWNALGKSSVLCKRDVASAVAAIYSFYSTLLPAHIFP